MKIHRFVFLLICLAPGLRAFDAANYGDGLYAVFTVSGGVSGEFAVQLHYDKVPLTVANFVALAEGSRPWIEESTGALVSEPFYDGITFHRVIAGFVIQAGSPNGLGTDGPGYSFPDEIDPALFHTQAGVLSMANSGVNTNGSQFFITLNPTTNLDGKHTVFGEVVENQSVVNTIGNTPTGGNDRPLTDVFIDSIEIVRQGTAAEAFDVNAWQLPDNQSAEPFLTYENDVLSLNFDREQTSSFRVYATDNLISWTFLGTIGPTTDAAAPLALDRSNDLNNLDEVFYQVVESQASPWIDNSGGVLAVSLAGLGDFTLELNEPFSGTYSSSAEGDFAIEYIWLEVGRIVQLVVETRVGSGNVAPMQLYLDFTTPTSGTAFARRLGTLLNPPSADNNDTGTFTYTPGQ